MKVRWGLSLRQFGGQCFYLKTHQVAAGFAEFDTNEVNGLAAGPEFVGVALFFNLRRGSAAGPAGCSGGRLSLNLLCIWMAIEQEGHHFSGVFCQVKPDHVFIELLRFGCGDTDRINAG